MALPARAPAAHARPASKCRPIVDRQSGDLAAGRLAHFVGDDLTDLEDLLGASEGDLARLVIATPRPAGLSNWWPSAFSSSRTWALMV